MGGPSPAFLEQEQTEKSRLLTALSLFRGVFPWLSAQREVWKAFRISNSGNTALSPRGGHTQRLHRETHIHTHHTHTHKCAQTKRNLHSVHLSTWSKRMANIAKSGLGRRGPGVFRWILEQWVDINPSCATHSILHPRMKKLGFKKASKTSRSDGE